MAARQDCACCRAAAHPPIPAAAAALPSRFGLLPAGGVRAMASGGSPCVAILDRFGMRSGKQH